MQDPVVRTFRIEYRRPVASSRDETESLDKHIGRAVAQWRTSRRMRQVDLADKMQAEHWNWAQATVWNVEQGNRPLRLAEAASLASIFNVSLEALLARPLDAAILEANRASEAAAKSAEALTAEASARADQAAALSRLRVVEAGEPITADEFSWAVFKAFSGMDWVGIEAIGSQLGLSSEVLNHLGKVHATWRRNLDGPVYFPHEMAASLAAVLPTVEQSPE